MKYSFFKENKNVGPRYVSYGSGPSDNWNYTLEKYKSKLRKDPSLHPIDIYEDEYVLEYFPSEPELSVKYMFGDMNVSSVANFQLPTNPIKLIEVESDKSLYEKLYSSKPTHHAIGDRYIKDYSSKNPKINGYRIRRGHLTFNVRWWLNTANFMYALKYYKGSFGKDVGPEAGGSASIKFNMPDGKSILSYNRKLYEKEYANNNKWPKPDLLDNFNLKRPQYFSYPDPSWASSNPLNIGIANSQLWRGDIYPGLNDNFRFYYMSNNNISVITKWLNGNHTEYSVFKDLHKIYEIKWFSNAKPKYLQGIGHLQRNGIRFEWNEDGSFKPDRHPTTGRITLKYLKKYENIPNAPSLDVLSSSRMMPDQNLPSIPQSELTPMFKRIWGEGNIEISAPSYESISEQNQFENTQTEQSDSKEEDNYQQLQRQEFFTLASEVQKIIEKADESFNKKYWNDPNSSRVTINRTNPKQEALDILRRAIPKVKAAKYRENEAALNHLLAMKFTEYSGRVFGYESKQDFFIEAAKLINRSDQLIESNKYMQEKQKLSEQYCLSAEVWREMTRKAQWGDQAYNKMACDKKVMQQYERAVQTDPNNQKARRILENLKAPKKAIPAALAKFEAIPDESWNKAQEEMMRLQAEKAFEEMTKEPEMNPLEVAEMTLEFLEGTVSIKRSGATNWEVVTDSHILLFNRDRIKTSEDAKGVSITYSSDQTFLAIKNSAEVEIIDESSLSIIRGGSFIHVLKKGKKFIVYTPTCAVGVRGTEFEVKVADDKSTETFLFEGLVELRNGSDIGYLVPGQKMSASKSDPRLNQSDFNTAQRMATHWSSLEQQKRKHEQIKANVPIKASNNATQKRGVFSNIANKKNPFAGASSGNTNKPKTKPKIYDSQPKYDKIPDRKITRPSIQDVQICASPDKQYHAVLVSSNLDYEYTALVARCPVNVNRKTALRVNWYYNNQPQPISVGNYEVLPQASQYDATVFSYDGPLNPGDYRVEFLMNAYVIGKGSVIINPQERYGEQEAQQYYVEAIKGMDIAIQLLNGGDYANAGEMARSTFPVLQSVLYNAPNLPDVLSVLQTAQTIISMDKVSTSLQQDNARKALEWAHVSLATINSAYQNSKDPQFRQTLGSLKKVVEEIVFELKKL